MILVTGAAGFAGSHLLDLLAGDGHDIVAWHRPGGMPPREIANVAWEAIDLLDRGKVAEAIQRRRPTAVYHLAGAAHVGAAWDRTASTLDTNVRGTHFLIEALRGASLAVPMLVPSSALVYASSSEPLSEDAPLLPAGPYALSKLAQELLASRAGRDGIDARIARAFNHIGPRQDPSFSASGFARQIAEIETGIRSAKILVGNLDAKRDLTDVRDTVRGYRAILERGRPGRPYNVCSGRAIAIGDVVDRLAAKSRVRVDISVDPARFRPSDVPLVEGSLARIRDELGWTPQIPLEQTLDDVLAYWRERVGGSSLAR